MNTKIVSVGILLLACVVAVRPNVPWNRYVIGQDGRLRRTQMLKQRPVAVRNGIFGQLRLREQDTTELRNKALEALKGYWSLRLKGQVQNDDRDHFLAWAHELQYKINKHGLTPNGLNDQDAALAELMNHICVHDTVLFDDEHAAIVAQHKPLNGIGLWQAPSVSELNTFKKELLNVEHDKIKLFDRGKVIRTVRNWVLGVSASILLLDLAIRRKKSLLFKAGRVVKGAAVATWRWISGRGKPEPASAELSPEECQELAGMLLEEEELSQHALEESLEHAIENQNAEPSE